MSDRIVDACCLINLYASGQIQRIIPACGGEFYVTKQVQGESLTIRQPDANDPNVLVPVPIDLAQSISGGLIHHCVLEGAAELQAYVEFAAQLDDGEASSLAIALSRGWILATDDRKATRLATSSGVTVITTPELVERWVIAAHPSKADVLKVLQSIERFARFRPRRGSPGYDWWAGYSDRS